MKTDAEIKDNIIIQKKITLNFNDTSVAGLVKIIPILSLTAGDQLIGIVADVGVAWDTAEVCTLKVGVENDDDSFLLSENLKLVGYKYGLGVSLADKMGLFNTSVAIQAKIESSSNLDTATKGEVRIYFFIRKKMI